MKIGLGFKGMIKYATHKAWVAAMQDFKDTLDLPAITIPVKVAYVLCDNCEQYHEPEKACALTEGSEL